MRWPNSWTEELAALTPQVRVHFYSTSRPQPPAAVVRHCPYRPGIRAWPRLERPPSIADAAAPADRRASAPRPSLCSCPQTRAEGRSRPASYGVSAWPASSPVRRTFSELLEVGLSTLRAAPRVCPTLADRRNTGRCFLHIGCRPFDPAGTCRKPAARSRRVCRLFDHS